jgi:hypothetical protein
VDYPPLPNIILKIISLQMLHFKIYFKFRVNAEVESICKIGSDALLLSLLLLVSRRELFPILDTILLAVKNNHNTDKYLAK